MRRVAAIVASGALIQAATLSAQTNGVPEFWDALHAAPTLSAANSVTRPAAASSAQQRLIDGMLRLRTYELTFDRTDALVATRALEEAVERAPKDPWARYALGAALGLWVTLAAAQKGAHPFPGEFDGGGTGRPLPRAALRRGQGSLRLRG